MTDGRRILSVAVDIIGRIIATAGWRSWVLDEDDGAWERRSTVRVVPPVQARKLAKVPFVEMADGRLQGVVSSGSDVSRVYVSSITAGTHGNSCSTNNNRPCGGLTDFYLCKHLDALVTEGIRQYGQERVARYLRVEVGEGKDLIDCLNSHKDPAPAAAVFSRFLRHLAYLEVPESTEPVPELHWFPAAGAVG
ncbi:hypothetical protein BZB76_2430 [Actinomadura pelletieri DSM 43383]|uniref:Uncharacterized protein n=1 Tax=Actinomadura pelletieri DSM 43383 TaxID=1120940 RepID=A0A495QUF7_9ACTN|nr:hypothetical protein [Actinomadura pelletieri]RKS77061.1 hypothetical protein BZB76_2430 [Actinomadura pelletieri DSM 43383]